MLSLIVLRLVQPVLSEFKIKGSTCCILFANAFVKILYSVVSKSTGRQFLKSVRSPFLNKHRHAKRARVILFGDRSIRRTVHSNDLVKFWVAMYSKKETGNL